MIRVKRFNLGTGKGTSVKEAVAAFEKACGHEINHVSVPEEPVTFPYAMHLPIKPEKVLGFKAKRISMICAHPAGIGRRRILTVLKTEIEEDKEK